MARIFCTKVSLCHKLCHWGSVPMIDLLPGKTTSSPLNFEFLRPHLKPSPLFMIKLSYSFMALESLPNTNNGTGLLIRASSELAVSACSHVGGLCLFPQWKWKLGSPWKLWQCQSHWGEFTHYLDNSCERKDEIIWRPWVNGSSYHSF